MLALKIFKRKLQTGEFISWLCTVQLIRHPSYLVNQQRIRVLVVPTKVWSVLDFKKVQFSRTPSFTISYLEIPLGYKNLPV
jgi:hypothetical protein